MKTQTKEILVAISAGREASVKMANALGVVELVDDYKPSQAAGDSWNVCAESALYRTLVAKALGIEGLPCEYCAGFDAVIACVHCHRNDMDMHGIDCITEMPVSAIQTKRKDTIRISYEIPIEQLELPLTRETCDECRGWPTKREWCEHA